MLVGMACALADSSDFGLLEEQSSQKCEIPCLGRKRRANYDTASFILGGEICNCTNKRNKQNYKQ